MKIYRKIDELIGNTPLLELSSFSRAMGVSARILAKLEYFNPAGSVKDRVAKAMLDDAQSKGLISRGSTIIEPTSGNTGIGLAALSAARGFRAIIVMPDSMSVERRRIVAAYGAKVVLTDGAKGMSGAIEKAEELAKSIPHSFIPGQFRNPANPKVHFETTGPEIWNDTDGRADIFVAGVGTGGTITGVGRYLKKMNPQIKIVAVEPSASPTLSRGKSGAHKIQGIGAGFVPPVLDVGIIDETVCVDDEEAFETVRTLGKLEGVSVGISSGAAACAAVKVSSRPENADKTVVVMFPDAGERYLSTPLFDR